MHRVKRGGGVGGETRTLTTVELLLSTPLGGVTIRLDNKKFR